VRWFQWKICRGPLDEQKIPRGGTRAVQPGMPFPNFYQCNKVLVNQKQIVWLVLQLQAGICSFVPHLSMFAPFNLNFMFKVLRMILMGNSKMLLKGSSS
jgi:hypothetical protein